MAEDRFAGRSQAYIEGFLAMEAQLAAQAQARKAGRPSTTTDRPAAQPLRTDEFRTGAEAGDFRTDNADAGAPAAKLAGAAAARHRMMLASGTRADTADLRSGLVDLADRAARDAATIAKLDAARQAQAVEMHRKLAALGIRQDASDPAPAATAAKAKMQVRSDMYAFAQPEPETRSDHVPDRNPSAAAARQKLHAAGC